MKAQIHPQWYPQAKVTCACGNKFTVGSTVPEIQVEVCSACHPLYTGVAKFMDIKGRVERFSERVAKGQKVYLSKHQRRELKKQERIKEELGRPESLAELRKKR